MFSVKNFVSDPLRHAFLQILKNYSKFVLDTLYWVLLHSILTTLMLDLDAEDWFFTTIIKLRRQNTNANLADSSRCLKVGHQRIHHLGEFYASPVIRNCLVDIKKNLFISLSQRISRSNFQTQEWL